VVPVAALPARTAFAKRKAKNPNVKSTSSATGLPLNKRGARVPFRRLLCCPPFGEAPVSVTKKTVNETPPAPHEPPYIHPTAVVDDGAILGAGTKIWHFAHIMSGAILGEDCMVGHASFVGACTLGRGVRIQNHVSVFEGVTLEDFVFVGPHVVFTNDLHPRVERRRTTPFLTTRIARGASLGANATILPGVTIGQYALIAAGAVITKDVPSYAMFRGNPGRFSSWVCRCGVPLSGNHCDSCSSEYLIGETCCPAT